MKFEEQSANLLSEEELQRLRKSRYQRAIEGEKNIETRETIDIFETPLFLRYDYELSSYLDYARMGGIRARGKTISKINPDTRRPSLRSRSIFLEAPIPQFQLAEYVDKRNPKRGLSKELDASSEGFRDINARNGSVIWKMAKDFHREFPEIDSEVIAEVIVKSTRLSHKGEYYGGEDLKIAHEEKSQRQAFIQELLANPMYRKIWIAGQKIALQKEQVKDVNNLLDIGLHSDAFKERGSTFLVSPEKTDIFTIADAQWHDDYMLEILAVKDIPQKQILGYLEYQKEDADEMLTDEISKEAEEIYGNRTFDYIIQGLNKMIDEVLTGYSELTRMKSHPDDLKKIKKELCAVLNMDESHFSTEEARKKIETTPGVYARYFEHAGHHSDRKNLSIRRIESFPDIPTEELTLKEIYQRIFESILPILKKLFPLQNFAVETVNQDIATALTQYIVDRFKVDPKEITKKDFIHLVVKSMGIPIYDLKGNQLWPQNKTYDEIHNSTQIK